VRILVAVELLELLLQSVPGFAHPSESLGGAVEDSLPDWRPLSFLLVLLQRLLYSVEFLGIEGVEDLMSQSLAVVDDLVPLFPSFPVLQQGDVIVDARVAQFIHTELLLPLLL
jgi:hypothetical protein